MALIFLFMLFLAGLYQKVVYKENILPVGAGYKDGRIYEEIFISSLLIIIF